MKKLLLMFVLVLAPTLAWAHTCPAYVDMIDESLAMAEEMGLDEQTVEEIEALRDQGKAYHEAGDHDQAIAVLDQALGLIESGGQ
ncbi:hypothetical protein [Natronospira bacteriovora]|uniref:Tetratricopeptide repeat protein n=1 Tax=Natronospira bacteriovora TaxID=3069753 RepID=A0ABU0WBD0_9GAMM|nr:hypothetical protein [Natronospira sp. AB-CW4]MDQ2070245.1 hypothetical protein [Natronospira sp. AB-CW4]